MNALLPPRVARSLYSALLYLSLPLLFARLVWRARRNPGYLRGWGERLGFVPRAAQRGELLWVHAVSVGEVQAAVPLLDALAERYPDLRMLVTTTTPTGAERVRSLARPHLDHCHLPFDLPDAVHRFLERKRPIVGVIMETELWPNLIAACGRRGVPVILANARLSARSAAGYARVPALTRQMLSRLDAIAAQGADDAGRLIALGADPARTVVSGSIKFDVRVSASVLEQGRALRARWGPGRGVFIAASTHEGEDALVLDAFARILETIPNCMLVLVPRHPERFDAVAALSRRRGYSTARRTSAPPECGAVDVFIGDTMGELQAFYAGADVAFVGGSLVPVGGHNMLEPAALGVPVLHGPHCFNFAEIAARLDEERAAATVADVVGLAEAACSLLTDADRRHGMGQRGSSFVERNRGALDRLVTVIDAEVEAARTAIRRLSP